jgi:Mrp family chromosome partitioning ATPase
MQAVTIGNRIHIASGAPGQGFSTTAVHDALVFEDARRRRAVRK